jgi:hypothetical protein
MSGSAETVNPAAFQRLDCRLPLHLEFEQVQTRVKEEEVPTEEMLREDEGQVRQAVQCKRPYAAVRERREVIYIPFLCF